MHVISHILHYKLLNLTSYFRRSNIEDRLKVIVGAFVVLLFFAASLYFFYYVFDYLAGLQDIGILLIDKIISIGFLAIFIMLIISNIVTAVSTLFRSEETAGYFASPISHQNVFIVRFIDNIMYSTWGVILLGVPIVIAYGLVRGFSWWGFLVEIFLVLIPFIIIPACLGVVLTIVIYLVSRHVPPKPVFIALTVVCAISAVLYIKLGQTSALTHSVFADWRILNRFLGSLAATSFPYLPSFWVAETMRFIAGAENANFGIYFFALVATTAFLLRGMFVLAQSHYYSSWQVSVEIQSSTVTKPKRALRLPRFFHLPDWLPPDFKSVLAKDIKLFIREPSQWAQFSLLLVLLIIYLVNLRHFPTNINDKFWNMIISFANFAFTGFILATLSVRFVFPNISLEGKSFWVIASSPMPIKRLFWEKFWLAFLIFLLIAEVIAFISNLILGLKSYMMLLSFFSILLMSISLTSLSVGLGAIFPRFEEANPGRIASSIGGMVTTVLSLVYVGLMVVILAMPTYYYSAYIIDGTISFPKKEFLIAGTIILILNLATIIIPVRIGIKKLSEREF